MFEVLACILLGKDGQNLERCGGVSYCIKSRLLASSAIFWLAEVACNIEFSRYHGAWSFSELL